MVHSPKLQARMIRLAALLAEHPGGLTKEEFLAHSGLTSYQFQDILFHLEYDGYLLRVVSEGGVRYLPRLTAQEEADLARLFAVYTGHSPAARRAMGQVHRTLREHPEGQTLGDLARRCNLHDYYAGQELHRLLYHGLCLWRITANGITYFPRLGPEIEAGLAATGVVCIVDEHHPLRCPEGSRPWEEE